MRQQTVISSIRAAWVFALCSVGASLWSGETAYHDHITALRALAEVKIHWRQTDTKFAVPQQEFMRIKGRYFHIHSARGNLDEVGNRGVMYAYNPRGYYLLRVNRGQMMFERDPVNPATPLNLSRSREIPVLLRPIEWLGIPDGDSSEGLFWPNVFDDEYLKQQFAKVVSKQEPDGKGGFILTVPTKSPVVKNGVMVMDQAGNHQKIMIGSTAQGGPSKLVNCIEYYDATAKLTGRYEFDYDIVLVGEKGETPAQSVPLLKAGRFTAMSTGKIVEQFERVDADLAATITDEDLIIDPLLAKDMYDAGTGLTFTPDQ